MAKTKNNKFGTDEAFEAQIENAEVIGKETAADAPAAVLSQTGTSTSLSNRSDDKKTVTSACFGSSAPLTNHSAQQPPLSNQGLKAAAAAKAKKSGKVPIEARLKRAFENFPTVGTLYHDGEEIFFHQVKAGMTVVKRP